MKRTRTACGMTAMTLTLGACGMNNGGDAAESGGGGRSIVIDEPFAPAAGWALETDDAFVLSKAGCLETLVSRADSGELAPMLATSWKQTTPRTWKFTLRSGATFQNGDPFDAKAVTAALQHALKVKAPSAAFGPDAIAGVKALDKGTVAVTTVAPDPLVPERLATPNTGILAPQAYQKSHIDPKGTCTGPFTLAEEVPQQSVRMKRNDSYWGGRAKLASAEVRFIADGAKRATQIQTGEAQLVRKLPATSTQDLKGSSGIRVDTAELSRTTSLILNNKKAPLDNVKVRQAIQAVVDTKKINQAVYFGAARPAVGPFAPTEPFAPSGAQPVKADPAKARALLAQAGVEPSSIKVQLLTYTEGASFADLAAVLQDQLKSIGIKVTIKTADYASLEPEMLSGDFDMTLLSRNHLGDMPDPLGFLAADYSCKGSFNVSHFCDPRVDALIHKAGTTTDRGKRYAIESEAASVLQSHAVNVFLVHDTESVARSSRVTGYSIDPYYTLTANLDVAPK
ncbi:ABC transporter substrate-binding protein [Streptomyces sp. NPDC088400]|uniref:ABC transporter substrate-binding protein n=1 Tax=Streptomyces sp. NPDC088400 TaxID=3365861 RepID=UPI0038141E90